MSQMFSAELFCFFLEGFRFKKEANEKVPNTCILLLGQQGQKRLQNSSK